MKLTKLPNSLVSKEVPINLNDLYEVNIKCAHVIEDKSEDRLPFDKKIYGTDNRSKADLKYLTIAAVQQLNNRVTAIETGKPIPDDQTVISDISIDPQRIDALESQMKDITKKLNNLITIVNKLTKKVPII